MAFETKEKTEAQKVSHHADNLLLWADRVPAAANTEHVRLYEEFWAKDNTPEYMNALLAELRSRAASYIDLEMGKVTESDALTVLFMENIRFNKWIMATRPDLLANARTSKDGTKLEFRDPAWDLDPTTGAAIKPTEWVENKPAV